MDFQSQLHGQLQEPAFWVAVAFLILMALGLKPLVKFAITALDKRSAQIDADLKEAARLRAEAEALLAAYQQKQKEMLAEAEKLLQQAKADAQSMAEKAEAELKDSLEKRRQLAIQRIAQSEAKAVQMVQQNVVDIAVSAAKVVLGEQLAAGQAMEVMKLAIADIGKQVH
jgi:F-type H+-transporting ATPase subunit b